MSDEKVHAIDCDLGVDCSCKPDPKYVCVRCGGVDIEVKAWVDPNAEEITTTDVYNDDSWCNTCEAHDTVVTFEQYQEHKKKEQAHADDRTD